MKRLLIGALFAFSFSISARTQDTARLLQQNLKLYPILWHQSGAEYRALCYQAFNTAKRQIDDIRRKRFRKEKLAIVTDLDETILDNSYAEANLIRQNMAFSDSSWKRWVNTSSATAVPGSIAFLQYAKQRGADIFYISNRSLAEIGPTLVNMRNLQIPDADSSHLLFYSTVSSKEERRQTVQQTHKIIMLIGDNLNDFSRIFEKGSIAERFRQTDLTQSDWGRTFIVLPNVIYGEWENAFYEYQRGLDPGQRQQMLQKLLKGF